MTMRSRETKETKKKMSMKKEEKKNSHTTTLFPKRDHSNIFNTSSCYIYLCLYICITYTYTEPSFIQIDKLKSPTFSALSYTQSQKPSHPNHFFFLLWTIRFSFICFECNENK